MLCCKRTKDMRALQSKRKRAESESTTELLLSSEDAEMLGQEDSSLTDQSSTLLGVMQKMTRGNDFSGVLEDSERMFKYLKSLEGDRVKRMKTVEAELLVTKDRLGVAEKKVYNHERERDALVETKRNLKLKIDDLYKKLDAANEELKNAQEEGEKYMKCAEDRSRQLKAAEKDVAESKSKLAKAQEECNEIVSKFAAARIASNDEKNSFNKWKRESEASLEKLRQDVVRHEKDVAHHKEESRKNSVLYHSCENMFLLKTDYCKGLEVKLQEMDVLVAEKKRRDASKPVWDATAQKLMSGLQETKPLCMFSSLVACRLNKSVLLTNFPKEKPPADKYPEPPNESATNFVIRQAMIDQESPQKEGFVHLNTLNRSTFSSDEIASLQVVQPPNIVHPNGDVEEVPPFNIHGTEGERGAIVYVSFLTC